MTIRELNAVLREPEISCGDNPLDRLVALIAVIGAGVRGQKATVEQIAISIDKFEAEFGPVTTTSVDEFAIFNAELLDLDLPDEFIVDSIGGRE